MSARERTMRFAKNTCGNCTKQGYIHSIVEVNGKFKAYCPDCLVQALLDKKSLEVQKSECDRCNNDVWFYYHVYWLDQNDIWCKNCTEEVLQIQKEPVVFY